jgi:hypothetical protein
VAVTIIASVIDANNNRQNIRRVGTLVARR